MKQLYKVYFLTKNRDILYYTPHHCMLHATSSRCIELILWLIMNLLVWSMHISIPMDKYLILTPYFSSTLCFYVDTKQWPSEQDGCSIGTQQNITISETGWSWRGPHSVPCCEAVHHTSPSWCREEHHIEWSGATLSSLDVRLHQVWVDVVPVTWPSWVS